MSSPLLEIRGLAKRFGGIAAVDNVSFSVAPGEILGLIGPNGAGKTTLVDLITGVQRCNAGEIIFSGKPVTPLPSWRRSALGMSRTFQITRPFEGMTVRENVTTGALFGVGPGRAASVAAAGTQADEIIRFCGLERYVDEPVTVLTTAFRKRLEMARCLAVRPRLLFLDEALAGLNPKEVSECLELIRRVNGRGVTVVFIEHNVPAVMSICHRLVVVSKGQKIAEGEPQAIVRDQAVRQAYLGGAQRDAAGRQIRPAGAGGGQP